MASEVDICNLALAHLGDTATVASLDPPEGSAQAEHCARFYPIARDSLLEMHPWSFASKRTALAQLTSEWAAWDYCYAMPSDALNVIEILSADATDDYSVSPATTATPLAAGAAYVPQPFACAVNSDGIQVIYTDQADAILRYTAIISDTTTFSPLFVAALGHHLASMLAGPILKGDQGAAESKRQSQLMAAYLSNAQESDAGQRRIIPAQIVPWIAGR